MGLGDDSMLLKIAVFGIAMSMMCTVMITVLVTDNNSDYTYQQLRGYRDELGTFTGQSMVSSTPWILTGVYTPWNASDGVEGHMTADYWLYGSEIAGYSDLGKSADIHLDKTQKSNTKLTIGDDQSYRYRNGREWWAGGNDWGFMFWNPDLTFGLSDGYTYAEGTARNWSYSGYRYNFDPMLPFTAGGDAGSASLKDGSLSIVWYDFGNYDEGLSGGLDIYGGSVILASYAAADIVAAYQSSSGYSTQYQFDFNGTLITLSIRFDQDVIESGTDLMSAWSNGNWSMAVFTPSAGNFYDLENSNTFMVTAGSMMDTFVNIFTFNAPTLPDSSGLIGEFWNWLLWLLVGLPFTIAALCVTLRIVGSIRMVI